MKSWVSQACNSAASLQRQRSSKELGTRVRRFAGSRVLVAAFALFALSTPFAGAADGAVVGRHVAPSYILVGFAGGFVRHDDPHHGPVKLAEHLRQNLPKDAYLPVFENRHRKGA